MTSSIGLARFGYTMILPAMQKSLDLTNTETGKLATANLVAYLFMALIGGYLASRFSPRRVTVLFLFMVGITMGLTGLVGSLGSAIFLRALTGIGSGGSNVPMMGMLSAWFGPKRRGLATGIAVMGSGFGFIVSGPLISFLLQHTGEEGWRTGWFVLGGGVVLVAVLAAFFLRNSPSEIGLSPIGNSVAPQPPSGGTASNVPGGLQSWARVYRSRMVWHLSLIYAHFGLSYIIFTTFYAKYLESEIRLGKGETGLLVLTLGVITLPSSLFWGWISDFIGRKYPMAIVLIVQGLAYLVFARWQTMGGAILSTVLFGLTAWSIPAIMASACGDHVGGRFAPAALGIVTLFLGIGQAIGPIIAGRMADRMGSFSPAFLFAMVIAFIGSLFALLLPRAGVAVEAGND